MRFVKEKPKPYYCEVEYLQSSGTQYIDTLQNNNTGYFYKTAIEPLSDGAWVLWFGRQETSSGMNCDFVGYNGDNKLGASVISPGVGNTIGKVDAPINNLYKIESSSVVGDVYFSVNGTKTSAVRSGNTSTKNAYIFCINNAGTANNFVSMRLYYFQMRDKDNVLVRDFIPVLDWSMTPCLYDKVSGQLFYNQGTGDFTYGREIHYVEYLESTGTQYIDSGFTVSNTNTITCNYMLTNSVFSQQSVFGSRERNVQNAVQHGQYQNDGWYVIGTTEGSISGATRLQNHYVSYNKGKIYFGDTEQTATLVADKSSQVYTTPHSLVFFAEYNEQQGGIFLPATVRIYDFKILDSNDNLVRNFNAAADENGVGFMFDRVEHKIYDNAGTGSFVFNQPEEEVKSPAIRLIKRKDTPYYCEVEYLESSGTQYIDTDYTSNDVENIKYKLGVYPLQNNNLQVMAGSQQYNSTQDCYSIQLNSTGRVFVGTYAKYYDSTALSNNTYYNIETYSEAGDRYTITNGTKVTNTTIAGGVNLDFPVVLFAHNTAGSVNYFSNIRLYYFQEYVNSVLVRDMIPVLDWNMTPCMYDKVSRKLFYNKGSGDFTYGRQIHYVDYLESTGTQYIDTGVNADSNLGFETRYALTSAIESQRWGAIKDNGSSRYSRHHINVTISTQQDTGYMYGEANLNDYSTVCAFETLNLDEHFLSLDATTHKVNFDGTIINTKTGSFDIGLNYWLFRRNGNNDSLKSFINVKYYYFKLYNGSTLVRDYKGAVDENGVGFMFDKVEHKIYDNAGTGAFKYPDIKLEYLRGTGTQYINTGVNMNQNSSVYVKGSGYDGSMAHCFFGVQETDANNQKMMYYELCVGHQESIRSAFGYTQKETWLQNSFIANKNFTINKNKGVITYTDLDNNLSQTETIISNNFQTTIPLYLFSRNLDGTSDVFATYNVISSQIYDNNTLVRDFVPILRNGVAGMLDRVNNVFYTNQGTGSFGFKIKEKKIPKIVFLYTGETNV